MPDKQQLEEILGRIGKKLDASFEPLEVDGRVLRTLAINNMQSHLDWLLASNAIRQPLRDLPLWAKVWPASLVLGRFLRKYDPVGKNLLELGCGMGVCSLVASAYGFAGITATDINADALDFARANVLENGLEDTISVKYLDVANAPDKLREQPDYICASELLYLDSLHRPLIRFLKKHMPPTGKAFFCVDLARDKKIFEKLAAREFRTQAGCIGVKTESASGAERKIYKLIILEKK